MGRFNFIHAVEDVYAFTDLLMRLPVCLGLSSIFYARAISITREAGSLDPVRDGTALGAEGGLLGGRPAGGRRVTPRLLREEGAVCETFRFAHPMEQVIATEKYCTNLHGANLWDLTSTDLQCMENGDQDHLGSAKIHTQLPGAGSALFWSPEP